VCFCRAISGGEVIVKKSFLSIVLLLQVMCLDVHAGATREMQFSLGELKVKAGYQDPSDVDVRLRDSRILPFYFTIENPSSNDVTFNIKDIRLNLGFPSVLEPIEVATVIQEIKRTKRIPTLFNVFKLISGQSSAFHPNRLDEQGLKELERKLSQQHLEGGEIKAGKEKEGYVFFMFPEDSGPAWWANLEFSRYSPQALETKGIKVYTNDRNEDFLAELVKFCEEHFLGEQEPFEKSYALLIGMGKYKHLPPLSSPPQDVEKMKDYLHDKQRFDEVCTVFDEDVTESTLKNPQTYFKKKIQNRDRFLFYYSGHGSSTNLNGHVRGYLPLVNERYGSYDSSIHMDSLVDWMRQLKAKHLLVILDCCFSGLAIGGLETKVSGSYYSPTISRAVFNDLAMGNARYLLMAGEEGEESIADKRWDGSLFTDAIIKGLEEGADTNNDKIVTVRELDVWLRPVVVNEAKKMNRELHPLLKDLEGGVSRGEFFFLR
jgi:uncharacterized caspase-like protein